MSALPWPGEVCKSCGRRNVIGFVVAEDVWAAVACGVDERTIQRWVGGRGVRAVDALIRFEDVVATARKGRAA